MSVHLKIKPEEVWNYFKKNEGRLIENVDCIAKSVIDDKIAYKIWITERDGCAWMYLEDQDTQAVIQNGLASGQISCESISTVLCAQLATLDEKRANRSFDSVSKVDGLNLSPSESAVDAEDLEMISERNAELIEITKDFIARAMGYDNPDEENFDEEEISEVFDELERVLYDLGYVCYHPQIVNVDGVMKVFESPYYEGDDAE